MGYTTYWKHKEIPQDIWDKKLETARVILDDFKDIIQLDDGSAPICNEDEIVFNGIGDNAHETFVLKRTAEEFNFCKTARKPYDTAVCAILLLFSDVVNVSSDGDREDWEEALEYWESKFWPVETPFLD